MWIAAHTVDTTLIKELPAAECWSGYFDTILFLSKVISFQGDRIVMTFSALRSWADPVACVAADLLRDALEPVLERAIQCIETTHRHSIRFAEKDQKDLEVTLKALLQRLSTYDPVAGSEADKLLWFLLPLKWIYALVMDKERHLALLLRRHAVDRRNDEVWALAAPFVRRSLGDISAQLQAAVAMMHVAVLVSNRTSDSESGMQSASGSTCKASRRRISRAMFTASSTSPEAAAVDDALLLLVAKAMNLHASEYTELLVKAGAILADAIDGVVDIAEKIREPHFALSGASHGSAVAYDKDDVFQKTGRFQAQLESRMLLSNREDCQTLARVYSDAHIRPYAAVVRRNEGLLPRHVDIMNTDYSVALVALLSLYQSSTQALGKFKKLMEERSLVQRAQAALTNIANGVAVLESGNVTLEDFALELATHCSAIQNLLCGLVQWLSSGNNHSTSNVSSSCNGVEREEEGFGCAGGVSSSPTARFVPQHRRASCLFVEQTAVSIDVFVTSVHDVSESVLKTLREVEEASAHILVAMNGLRHDESVTLFMLAKQCARSLEEARNMTALLRQEMRYVDPPQGAESWHAYVNALLSQAALIDENTGHAMLSSSQLVAPSALRKALLVLSSTVATIQDGLCQLLPTTALMKDALQMHKEVVLKSQQDASLQLVQLHEGVDLMQQDSLKVVSTHSQRRESDAAQLKELYRRASGLAKVEVAASDEKAAATSYYSHLEQQFVFKLLATLQHEGFDVSESVHHIISHVRELDEKETLDCIDNVSCFCTMIELLNRSLVAQQNPAMANA